MLYIRPTQWPHGLRRGSVVAPLLGLRVRIPPAGMNVCLLCMLCVVTVYKSMHIMLPYDMHLMNLNVVTM